MLGNLSQSYGLLGKYQDQVDTGKKITRPSQDPVVAMKGMAYRTNLEEITQYKRNFSEAHNWIDNSDGALDQTGKALARLRDLVMQASNDTLETNQRQAIAAEVKQIHDQIAEIANTKVGEKYIFNGTNTLSKPVEVDANGLAQVSSTDGAVQLELSKGVYIQVNTVASKIFSTSPDEGKGLFSDIESLITDLNSGKTGKDLDKYLTYVDNHTQNVLTARADIGARDNRLTLMEDRIDDQEVMAKQLLSEAEDVDYEKAITDLKTQEAVHNAALSVGARIIQPTLLDFLR